MSIMEKLAGENMALLPTKVLLILEVWQGDL